jgi:5-methylcytosine-specific restriction enzyme A
MRRVVIPCLVCGVLVQGGSRCSAHKRPDTRPTLAKRGSRSLSKRLRRQALVRDHFTCQRCGLRDRSGALLEADHIVELIDDGEHVLGNLQTLCKPCHREKTADAAARRKN